MDNKLYFKDGNRRGLKPNCFIKVSTFVTTQYLGIIMKVFLDRTQVLFYCYRETFFHLSKFNTETQYQDPTLNPSLVSSSLCKGNYKGVTFLSFPIFSLVV